MAQLLPSPVRFIFIYRGYVQIKGVMRLIRFDSFIRKIDPHQDYVCVDIMDNRYIYTIKGSNILNYHLYNVRPLTKHDPEYIST